MNPADMKRILLLLLVSLVVGLFVFGVRYELKKRARERREVAYQSALRSYAQVLKPGMTRKQVEDYFRANKLEFRQTCCVDMKEYRKGSWDDLVKIGEEDAPWFCNLTIVYVGFQFTGHGQFDGMWRADDFDKLSAVTLYQQYDKCL
jgi:Na+-transporting NADH:ubiquinone oxidoreductase subunit NqrC